MEHRPSHANRGNHPISSGRLFMFKDAPKVVRNTRRIMGCGSEHSNVDNGAAMKMEEYRMDKPNNYIQRALN